MDPPAGDVCHAEEMSYNEKEQYFVSGVELRSWFKESHNCFGLRVKDMGYIFLTASL